MNNTIDTVEGEKRPLFAFPLLSLDELRPFFLNPLIPESTIVKFINEMSQKFTAKRDQITDYVQDADHISAYTAIYLPTNLPKLSFLLDKLPPEILHDLKDRTFIDMGCGPGTFSLAWSFLLGKSKREIWAVDSSKIMQSQAEKILKGFFPDINLYTSANFKEKKPDSVLFFGHSINELGIILAQELISRIDPEYIMWIEPGTSNLFLELKELRSKLVEHYDIIYPCPSNEACPNSWCHQVLRISHDASVERLSQLVNLDRKILPMSTMVLKRKNAHTKAATKATVIRFVNETKFSFLYEVCYFDEKNKNIVVEILKKYLSKTEVKDFKNANVGERLTFDIEKKLEKYFRVRLK